MLNQGLQHMSTLFPGVATADQEQFRNQLQQFAGPLANMLSQNRPLLQAFMKPQLPPAFIVSNKVKLWLLRPRAHSCSVNLALEFRILLVSPVQTRLHLPYSAVRSASTGVVDLDRKVDACSTLCTA